MSNLLKIKNLYVNGNGKEILKGVDLEVEKGQIQAILGPNASGKSTLAQAILGNSKYKVTKGSILFCGKEIKRLSPEKRVKLGLALSWQSPPAIKGVKLSRLLEKISKDRNNTETIEHLLDREVNLDFSGGEKRAAELVQILALNPKLVIFDEIDSGLDLKKTETVAKTIKKLLLDRKVSVLLITHSGTILNFLKPDITSVIVDGRVICQEKDFRKVLRSIKRYGYDKCKKCKLSSN
ncbi:MAG: ATP-binding cassette domain-containing protein [Candidatus Pacebacteria bacterium]|nr:ATP-binding cassette domain-containing protein [Candidatus Paceibacterota bacterium]